MFVTTKIRKKHVNVFYAKPACSKHEVTYFCRHLLLARSAPNRDNFIKPRDVGGGACSTYEIGGMYVLDFSQKLRGKNLQ